MKFITRVVTTVCLFATVAIGDAIADHNVNLAKVVNMGATGIFCASQNSFQDIPDLTVSLMTNGGAVVVNFSLQVGLGTAAILYLRPSIDGLPPDETFIQNNNGTNQGNIQTLSYSQAFTLAKGSHVFGVQYACPGSGQAILAQRWHTVYELTHSD